MGGLEILLTNMLKAAGFNPEVLKKVAYEKTEEFMGEIRKLNNSLSAIDKRLSAIETQLGISAHDPGRTIPITASVAETGNGANSLHE